MNNFNICSINCILFTYYKYFCIFILRFCKLSHASLLFQVNNVHVILFVIWFIIFGSTPLVVEVWLIRVVLRIIFFLVIIILAYGRQLPLRTTFRN